MMREWLSLQSECVRYGATWYATDVQCIVCSIYNAFGDVFSTVQVGEMIHHAEDLELFEQSRRAI